MRREREREKVYQNAKENAKINRMSLSICIIHAALR